MDSDLLPGPPKRSAPSAQRSAPALGPSPKSTQNRTLTCICRNVAVDTPDR